MSLLKKIAQNATQPHFFSELIHNLYRGEKVAQEFLQLLLLKNNESNPPNRRNFAQSGHPA
jgi:hypothetical protein